MQAGIEDDIEMKRHRDSASDADGDATESAEVHSNEAGSSRAAVAAVARGCSERVRVHRQGGCSCLASQDSPHPHTNQGHLVRTAGVGCCRLTIVLEALWALQRLTQPCTALQPPCAVPHLSPAVPDCLAGKMATTCVTTLALWPPIKCCSLQDHGVTHCNAALWRAAVLVHSAILSGLVVAQDYRKGQELVRDREFAANADFFQAVFEVGRRYKIMNPDKMRSEYGKLMYLLMDSADPAVQDLLEFKCVKPLKTVASFLEERGAGALLEDGLMTAATAEIVSGKWPLGLLQGTGTDPCCLLHLSPACQCM
ncbi:uncharacterized protein HaLaN_08663 [Haematococcus lacustris]|uniref:Non-canonical E2 ubiquitin-conjugating enzyme C-terminal domain-containing protein n=1 Tax=Haematococcus lacustris TaxID=44745 RepID=A0A699YZQ2_HAELA|nr:uncharacterized protein HaLaN_08663 [Haematococcus lacustris]